MDRTLFPCGVTTKPARPVPSLWLIYVVLIIQFDGEDWASDVKVLEEDEAGGDW